MLECDGGQLVFLRAIEHHVADRRRTDVIDQRGSGLGLRVSRVEWMDPSVRWLR